MIAWCQRSGRETAAALVILIAITLGMQACALFTKQNACSVINAADEICTVIAVPAPDGGTEHVRVSGSELRAFANERSAAHARDAGPDGGP